jgi:hypothetical protein
MHVISVSRSTETAFSSANFVTPRHLIKLITHPSRFQLRVRTLHCLYKYPTKFGCFGGYMANVITLLTLPSICRYPSVLPRLTARWSGCSVCYEAALFLLTGVTILSGATASPVPLSRFCAPTFHCIGTFTPDLAYGDTLPPPPRPTRGLCGSSSPSQEASSS